MIVIHWLHSSQIKMNRALAVYRLFRFIFQSKSKADSDREPAPEQKSKTTNISLLQLNLFNPNSVPNSETMNITSLQLNMFNSVTKKSTWIRKVSKQFVIKMILYPFYRNSRCPKSKSNAVFSPPGTGEMAEWGDSDLRRWRKGVMGGWQN